MSSALEAVKAVYSFFAAGELDAFLALCDGDIEWVVNGPASLEKCRAFHGRDGVRRFLEILGGSWRFQSFEAREFFSQGNTVVVLGEEKGETIASDESFENRWAHVFDLEGGKIVRFREFLCHWSGGQRPPAMSWGPV